MFGLLIFLLPTLTIALPKVSLHLRGDAPKPVVTRVCESNIQSTKPKSFPEAPLITNMVIELNVDNAFDTDLKSAVLLPAIFKITGFGPVSRLVCEQAFGVGGDDHILSIFRSHSCPVSQWVII